jgi:hypothetical protein
MNVSTSPSKTENLVPFALTTRRRYPAWPPAVAGDPPSDTQVDRSDSGASACAAVACAAVGEATCAGSDAPAVGAVDAAAVGPQAVTIAATKASSGMGFVRMVVGFPFEVPPKAALPY